MKIGMITDSLPEADFDSMLAAVGYDGVLSIEHEDPAMSAVEGAERSVALLRRVLTRSPAH